MKVWAILLPAWSCTLASAFNKQRQSILHMCLGNKIYLGVTVCQPIYCFSISVHLSSLYLFCWFFVLFCLGQHTRHMDVPKLGVSNSRSLTQWARLGIEPATLWMLVRFVSAEPRRELRLSWFQSLNQAFWGLSRYYPLPLRWETCSSERLSNFPKS